ncbi:hypothetical protein PR048_016874 [Dryococelus australis]|uniref:Uncharacterized protein n=1 Tax=Dryococelus australis TaxID=614101 RepID=A0ABQ9H854_9NEOP|nr:hypothetical protein PR048_016874 [Dryococelus australis]
MCAGSGWPQAMAAAALLLAAACSLAQAETFQVVMNDTNRALIFAGGWVPLTAPCPTCRNSRDVTRDAARPQATDAAQFHHPPPPLPAAPATAFVNQQVQQHFLQHRPDIQQLIGHPELLPQQILAPPTAQGFLQPSAVNLAALLQLQLQQQLQQQLPQQQQQLPQQQQQLLQQQQQLPQQQQQLPQQQQQLPQQQQQLPLQQQQEPITALPLGTPPLRPEPPVVQQSSTPRTSQNATDGEEVQLLYVPVETLRQRGRLQAERRERPQQEKREEHQEQRQQQTTAGTRQRPEQQRAWGQQKQQATTVKPAPHTPPLSVFMDNDGQAVRIADVIRVLKSANMIDVLDTVGPDSPQIFVGPSNLETPKGYTKFGLPYLSPSKPSKLFVAPLSYKAPQGYSKIPFPHPHVGSVVVSNDVSVLTDKNSNQEKTTESININARGRQQNTYSLPPDLPPINPQLPSLVNSLEDSARQGQNVLLVPQDDQVSTSSPAQIPTRPTYVFKQSQRTNFRAQEIIQDQQKSNLHHLSPTQPPQETLLVQPKPQYQSQAAVVQEVSSQVAQQPANNLLQDQFLNNQFTTQESITSSQKPETQRTGDRTSQIGRQLQRGRFQQNQFTEQEIVSESPSISAHAPTKDSQSQHVSNHFQRGQLHPTQQTQIPDQTSQRQTHTQNNQNQYISNQLQQNRFQQNSFTSNKESTVSETPSAPVRNEQLRSTSNQPQRGRYNHIRAQTESSAGPAYVQNHQDETYLTTDKFQRGRSHQNRLTEHTTEITQALEYNSRISTQTPAPAVTIQPLTATVLASNPTVGQQVTNPTIDSTKFQEYLDQLISNPQSSGSLSQSQEALQKLRELLTQNPKLLSPQYENTKPTEQDINQQNPNNKNILNQKESVVGFSQTPTAQPILPAEQSTYTTTTVSTTFGSFRRQSNRGRQRATTSTFAPSPATTPAPRRSYPRNRRPVQTRTRIQEPTTTTTTTEILIPNQNYELQAPVQNYPLEYFTQSQQHTPAQNFGSVGTVNNYQNSPVVASLVENSQYEEQTETPLTIAKSPTVQQNTYNQPIRHVPKRHQEDFATTTTTTHKYPSYETPEKGSSQRTHRFRGRQRTQQSTQTPLPKDDTFTNNNPSFNTKQTHQYTNVNTQLRQAQQTTESEADLQQKAQLRPLTPALSTEVTYTLTASPAQEFQQQIQTLQPGQNVDIGSQLQFQQQQYDQVNLQQPLSPSQFVAEQVHQQTEASPGLSPQQVVTTIQTPEFNPVTPKSSEYVQSLHTPESIPSLQRNGPRYTNIQRNRQRIQPNVVYQESFVQNQVQPGKIERAKSEEQNQNTFGGYTFDETRHQVTTTPRITIEETPQPIHAKLRGRTRTRQRVQGSELTSRKSQYLGSSTQKSIQEDEAYGFIQTTTQPLFMENFSEESTEQIPVLQRIISTATQSGQSSEYEARDYSTEVTLSSETPQHIIRAGLKKKIRGSARRQTTTVTPAPSTTTTENIHKVYTVRPIRRPNIKTKLVNTKGRIRRPTTPTTTPSPATTIQPILQATAPEWEHRRPGAQRFPYAGSNEVIAQTARSSLQKYTAKHPSNPPPWNQNPTETSLSAGSDFHINLGDNVNQPHSAQWAPPQDEGFFLNFGQSPGNVPYDQVGVGSQQQSSYTEEQKGAESQRYSTVYMMPFSSEERRKNYEFTDGSLTTTALPPIQEATIFYNEDQKKEHLTTELNTQQSVEESIEAEDKYTNLKKSADSDSSARKKNEGAGETGDPRENPLTSGIVLKAMITGLYGRRRGAWVRVRVTPSHQQDMETAESQNLATVSFNAISSPLPKATQSNDKNQDGLVRSSEENDLYTPDVHHEPPEEVMTTYPVTTTTPTTPIERTTFDVAELSDSPTTVHTYHNHKLEYDHVSEDKKAVDDENTNSFKDLRDMTTFVDSIVPASRNYNNSTAEHTSDISAYTTSWQNHIPKKEEYNIRGHGNIGTDNTEDVLNINEDDRHNHHDPTTTEAFVDEQDVNINDETSTIINYIYNTELHGNSTKQEIRSKWNDHEIKVTVKPENEYLKDGNTKPYVPSDLDTTKNEEKLPPKFNYKTRVQYKPNNLDNIRKAVLKITDKHLGNNISTQNMPSPSSTENLNHSGSKENNFNHSNLIATSNYEQNLHTNEHAVTGIKKTHIPVVFKKTKQKPSTGYNSQIYDTIQDIISKAEKYDSNESTEPEINFEIHKMNPRTSTTEPPMLGQLRILGTSTSTEVSHETEICYRGRCVKTKMKASDQVPVE